MPRHRSSFQRKSLRNFTGGLNTEAPPTDINDNELQVCENMFIDDFGYIRSRIGTVSESLSEMDTDVGAVGYNKYHNATDGAINLNLFMRVSDGNWYATDNDYTNPVRVDNGSSAIASDGTCRWQILRAYAAPTGTGRGCAFGFPDELFTANNEAWVWANKTSDIGNGAGKMHKLSSLTTGISPSIKIAAPFGRRIFGALSTQPMILVYFGPGMQLAPWPVVSLGIPLSDPSPITGLIGFNKRLFIFKEDKILMMVPDANSPETPTSWFFYVVSDKIGTRFPHTVKNVGNDVIFLSDYGIASLRAVQEFGDFQSAILSNKLSDLRGVDVATYPKTHAEIDPIIGHYVLALTNSTGIQKCFVFDYKQFQTSREPRWFQYTGDYLGKTLGSVIIDTTPRIGVGLLEDVTSGQGSVAYPYLPTDQDTQDDFFTDGNGDRPYTQRIVTKSLQNDTESYAKRINKLGAHIRVLKDFGGSMLLKYQVDDNPNIAEYNIQALGSTVNVPYDRNIIRRAINSSSIPRIYRNIKLTFETAAVGLGMMLKELFFDWHATTDKFINLQGFTVDLTGNDTNNPESFFGLNGLDTLTTTSFEDAGSFPAPGPGNGRFASIEWGANSQTFSRLALSFEFVYTASGPGSSNDKYLQVYVSTDDGVSFPTQYEFLYTGTGRSYVPVIQDISSLTVDPTNVRIAFGVGPTSTDSSGLSLLDSITVAATNIKLIGTFY